MTTLTDCIHARRSIRKYKATPPPRSDLMAMLSSTLYAPSPSNSRPVRYIEIATQKTRDLLRQKMDAGKESLLFQAAETGAPKRIQNLINVYYRYSVFMLSAPWLLAAGTVPVTSFSGRLQQNNIATQQTKRDDAAVALGASLQTLMLTGAELGIGTCTLTAPLVFMNDLSDIPGLEELSVRCFITAGYADETPGMVERSTLSDIFREI